MLELLFTIAVSTTVLSMAMPLAGNTLDELRTRMAARYLAGRIMGARLDAVRRSTRVGLKFEAVGKDYRFAAFSDGNGNGIRAIDIRAGTDSPLGSFERLRDKFSGVSFTLPAGIRDIDGSGNADPDGVRIGTARILTLSPDGTATAGTVYLRGRRALYAVRVLGATGRVRVFEYHSGDRTWLSR